MGNQISIKNKRTILASTGILISYALVRFLRKNQKKAEEIKEINLKKERESLTQFLLSTRITATHQIKFPKTKSYEKSIQNIQKLKNQIEKLKNEHNSDSKVLEIKKNLIELVEQEVSNLSAMCNSRVFETNQAKRRREIDFLDRYVVQVADQSRQSEIISFLSKKEILKDCYIPQRHYDEEYESLFDIIPSFFIELGVKEEYKKFIHFPLNPKEILYKDIEEYYQEKINILKDIEARKLFQDIDLKCPGVTKGFVAHVYIRDRLAISRGVEEEDIIRRKALLKVDKVNRMRGTFNELFLKLFPE